MIGLLCFVLAVLASPFKSKLRKLRTQCFDISHCRKLNRAGKRSRIGRCSWLMRDGCSLIWLALIGLFRSRASLQAEILTLRHQLNVLRRKSPQRLAFTSIDRLVFAGLYRLAPDVLDALKIVRPETVIRWHCAGFRAYLRWKSRPRGGRPKTPLELRQLIREISLANPLWGAPRIHGELLKLGIDVGQTTVAKYMARGRRPPSQGWKTFLHNHADGMASMDLFVVTTISFRLRYGLLILHHDRRQILLQQRTSLSCKNHDFCTRPTNVRYAGWSGLSANSSPLPSLTQLGHGGLSQ
jgi:hypothetical protein